MLLYILIGVVLYLVGFVVTARKLSCYIKTCNEQQGYIPREASDDVGAFICSVIFPIWTPFYLVFKLFQKVVLTGLPQTPGEKKQEEQRLKEIEDRELDPDLYKSENPKLDLNQYWTEL